MCRSASRACEPRELDVDDRAQVLARERVEDDDLVDAVQELGPEVLAERLEHVALHGLVGVGIVAAAVAGDELAARCSRS